MAAGLTLRLAASDAEVQACYPVLSQLRPHVRAEEFLARVRRQERQGYRLLAGLEEGTVVAVAGFRPQETLFAGPSLYVDDLVTDAGRRSRGYGAAMLRWLMKYAREQGFEELHLDSGVQRFDAHRFYLLHRMKITSHHFALDLRPGTD